MQLKTRNLLSFIILLMPAIFINATQVNYLLERFKRAVVQPNFATSDHSLIDNKECDQLKALCPLLQSFDNLSVLECIASLNNIQRDALPDKCQHAIWTQQTEHLSIQWLEQTLLTQQCADHKQQLSSCLNAVDIWNCLRQKVDKLDQSGDKCRLYVRRVFATFYDDFEQLPDFIDACGPYVKQMECGRLSTDKKLSQTETVQCLQETGADLLDVPCKTAITRIEEQKSYLDFFRICAMDLKRLCEQVSYIKNKDSISIIYKLYL